MEKVLSIIGGLHHPFEACAQILQKFIEETGRFSVECSTDRDLLKADSICRYDAVVVYTQGGELTEAQETGLTAFVANGGAFVGLHGATASWKTNDGYIDMLGGVFAGHGPVCEFPVSIVDHDTRITRRLPDSFRVTDELYILDCFDPDAVHVLATAVWRGAVHPVIYTKTYGKGRVYYNALGHDERTFAMPLYHKLVVRGLDWTLRRPEPQPLKAGVIGYGPRFNMGAQHLAGLRDNAGFELDCICDIDPARREAAKAEWPDCTLYASLDEALDQSEADIFAIVTPHATHAPLALRCLNAGRHVVVEKPLSVTVEEADAMIAAAQQNKRMLSVYHNRRWDGDYAAIQDVLRRGLIGEIFQLEITGSTYQHPGYQWRSDKQAAGGAFYNWGAHMVDWVLGLVAAPVSEVSGYFQTKRVWHDVTLDEHCNAMLRFENGACANVEYSHIGAIGRSRWRILGTQGAIEDRCEKTLRVVTHAHGLRAELTVPYLESDPAAYYRNIADHLLLGETLAVTPESARRTIAVIETAEKSSQAGKALPLPEHCR